MLYKAWNSVFFFFGAYAKEDIILTSINKANIRVLSHRSLEKGTCNEHIFFSVIGDELHPWLGAGHYCVPVRVGLLRREDFGSLSGARKEQARS